MRLRLHRLSFTLAIAALSLQACAQTTTLTQGWESLPGILERIVPPRFPDRTFDITRFGAVGDGTTDNTEVFRSAIEACAASGGGKGVGPFLLAAIELERGKAELPPGRRKAEQKRKTQ